MIAAPLYLICLAIELVHVSARFIVAVLVATALGHDSDIASLIALTIAAFPLLWSLGAFLGIPGGWGLMWEYGSRRPSPRDKATVGPVLDELRRRGVRGPLLWFVIDDPTPNAQAVGSTIYINSGLIDDPHLAPVLPHECGHLKTATANVLLALIRLEFPGLRVARVYLTLVERPLLAGTIRVLSGGASWQLPIIGSLWQSYFRRSEHRADRWAERLGYGKNWRRILTSTNGQSTRPHPSAVGELTRTLRTASAGCSASTAGSVANSGGACRLMGLLG